MTIDWLKIRDRYENGDETVLAICKAFRISPNQLYRRARNEDWTLRQNRQRDAGGDVMPLGKKDDTGSTQRRFQRPDRKILVDRLYKAFERQMADFEKRLNLTEDDGVNEKDARTLGSLARTLEKLIELRGEDEDSHDETEKEIDIERLRQELARRIELVRQKRRTD